MLCALAYIPKPVITGRSHRPQDRLAYNGYRRYLACIRQNICKAVTELGPTRLVSLLDMSDGVSLAGDLYPKDTLDVEHRPTYS